MPLNKNIKKVLLIGSGPIVIGQAAEFDYAGTQALRVLREAGIETVLVNSNPATIMTDPSLADNIYIEPLTLTTIKRIINKEKPDSILSGLGGQTGLTLCMQLAREHFLEENQVVLLGSSPETIDKAEDRQLFKEIMERIGQPVIPSEVVYDIENALRCADRLGYPIVVRPAFTLGGSGGGLANNEEELRRIASIGLVQSPIHQIMIEKSVAGWKEIEFEVMRDQAGNTIVVCSMENFDPVGIHTGDSIVIAPAVTLADREYQMLRSAALSIVDALKVEGGCNCQFALHPESFDYAVIEVNPRVSRSSALASKATGYPIAKVATKIAIGYTLDEIINQITGKTYAAFEPALDYVAVKLPKWPFDKFVYANRCLGTQMKATGEVMSIADTFEAALMKAIRGAEIGRKSLHSDKCATASHKEVIEQVKTATDERLFYIYEALRRGISVDKLHNISKIDPWFLFRILKLVKYEMNLKEDLTHDRYIEGKRLGYTDEMIAKISKRTIEYPVAPIYKMVDTCGGEFEAETPYFYSSYDTMDMGGKNEALDFINISMRKRIIVLGSGPIRIGQGIEFDYACVQCVETLKKMGYEVVVINNNPETVSTDFDIGDRLYFEPPCEEDVLHIVKQEKPIGVVVAFGGQTAIKLTKALDRAGIPILGTTADCIDRAEDRNRFDRLLEQIGILRPQGYSVMSMMEALKVANTLTYPVLIRPSYVLGGQNMIIAYTDDDVMEYMKIIMDTNPDSPILIDQYISGREIEVDAICDGEEILIPGIMEHIERTGIHSGDSIAVYPAPHINESMAESITKLTRKICLALEAKGLINIQFIVTEDQIYIIEVNPRASRTIPYLSKVTQVPICELAIKVCLGSKLSELGYGIGCYKANTDYVSVKVPVFSFEKLPDLDTQLGPEMKSTGEVLGIGRNLEEGLYKGMVAAGYPMCKKGGVFISVRDVDKRELPTIAEKFASMGYKLYATKGSAQVLIDEGIDISIIDKFEEGPNNAIKLMESGQINYIISTSMKGRDPHRNSVKLRRIACQLGIPCITSIDTAMVLVACLSSRYNEVNTKLIDINQAPTTVDFIHDKEDLKINNETKIQ